MKKWVLTILTALVILIPGVLGAGWVGSQMSSEGMTFLVSLALGMCVGYTAGTVGYQVFLKMEDSEY